MRQIQGSDQWLDEHQRLQKVYRQKTEFSRLDLRKTESCRLEEILHTRFSDIIDFPAFRSEMIAEMLGPTMFIGGIPSSSD